MTDPASPAVDIRWTPPLELIIAVNPDPESSLPYLIWLPVGEGLVFSVKETWPRASAVFCFPLPRDVWPAEPEIVERISLRSCVRRGKAIDVIADRAREHRSQIVYTTARGRDMVFWQSPNTRKQAKPQVRTPKTKAAGIETELLILVDTRERYAYQFPGRPVRTDRRALISGDYAVEVDGAVVAAVERKSISDLATSLTNGKLRFAVAELSALPRAAVVVEERYSQVFKQEWLKPAAFADGLAELQIRYPSVPIVFCDNRKLAQEWTYRYLAAATMWSGDE